MCCIFICLRVIWGHSLGKGGLTSKTVSSLSACALFHKNFSYNMEHLSVLVDHHRASTDNEVPIFLDIPRCSPGVGEKSMGTRTVEKLYVKEV